MVSEAYMRWLNASPLDKLQVKAPSSEEIAQGKPRLEQRVTTLLLPTLPSTMKSDLVATRRLHVGGILFAVHKRYQPGGQAEKQATLSALTSTVAAKDAQEAVTILRLWKRRWQEFKS